MWGRILPIPDVSNKKFPEAAKHEATGLHRILYRWSPEDYHALDKIWNVEHPEDATELVVEDNIPEGSPWQISMRSRSWSLQGRSIRNDRVVRGSANQVICAGNTASACPV